MAKQIIVTQNDYGIELETQFVDDKKKPLDITDYDVRVKIIYDDKTIDTILAGHKDSVNGIAYIVLEKEHLINAGLHTSVWSVVDEDEHVTAQENVYYFVKDVEGSEDDTLTTDLPIDADGVLNKFNEIDNNLFELTEQGNVVNEQLDNIVKQNYITNIDLLVNDSNIANVLKDKKNVFITKDVTVSDLEDVFENDNFSIKGNNNTLSSSDGYFTFKNSKNVFIENLIFDGKMLWFNNCDNVVIKKCTIKNTPGNAIGFDNCDNVFIEDCLFNNIGTIENIVPSSQGNGLYIKTCSNINIKNSKFTLNKGHGAIFIFNKTDILNIENCVFDNNYYRAISLSNTGETIGCISNNNISNCGKSNPNSSGVGCNGIFSSSKNKIKVINNSVKDVAENGIEGFFFEIKNNIIENTGKFDKVTPSKEGIYTSTECTISDNIIKNAKNEGIVIYSEDNVNPIQGINIINNTIITDEIKDLAIRIQSNPSSPTYANSIKNIVINNNVFNNYNYGLSIIDNSGTTENLTLLNNKGYKESLFYQDYLKLYNSVIDGENIAKNNSFSIEELSWSYSGTDRAPTITRENGKSILNFNNGSLVNGQAYIYKTFPIPNKKCCVKITYKSRNNIQLFFYKYSNNSTVDWSEAHYSTTLNNNNDYKTECLALSTNEDKLVVWVGTSIYGISQDSDVYIKKIDIIV